MMCDDFARKLANILKSLHFKSDSAIAFSGGLDSSIIAYLMKDENPMLYTVGIEQAKDVSNAMEIARLLGLRLQIIRFDEDDIIEGIGFLKRVDRDISAVELSFELPLYFVLRDAKEKVIYSGQGADELFGGYKKYLDRPQEMRDDLDKLLNKGVIRERKIAEKFNKELIYPYLNPEIVELAKEMPTDCKIRGSVRKWVLRRAAEIIGIPREVVKREKKAAQYGSGVWKTMKKISRDREISVSELVEYEF